MSNSSTRTGLSPEKEKELWRQQNIESLLECASLPFAEKIQMVENMIDVVRAFHGGKLPPSPDEHEEKTSL